ncbi:MAG: hypothetical protein AAB588_02220 [Patescibacteria group bacterium]
MADEGEIPGAVDQDRALSVVTGIPEELRTYLSDLLQPCPGLLELVLFICEQGYSSPQHKEAFERGVRIATTRSTDREVCGVGLSTDDVVAKQIFNGTSGQGRLDVLITNCQRKLEGMDQRRDLPITKEYVKAAFDRAVESQSWDYELRNILEFFRMAHTVRQIQKAAQEIFAAKSAEARRRLELASTAELPSSAYSSFSYLDQYDVTEIKAVAAGTLDPRQLSIDSPGTALQQIEGHTGDTVKGALK